MTLRQTVPSRLYKRGALLKKEGMKAKADDKAGLDLRCAKRFPAVGS